MNPDAFDIVDLDAVEAIVEPFAWSFARDRAAEIEEIWVRETAARPRTFDGPVLIQHRGKVEGRVFRAGYSTTSYKPFLAWQRLGNPAPYVRNGFAMAALRAADGAFLLGEMAEHTANAGRIYFAAGTPDPGDIVDGRVDLAGSVTRELGEETGLRLDEVVIGQGWRAVVMLTRVAFMRPVTLPLPAKEARMLILDRMRETGADELSDIRIVRGEADLDTARMPPFQVAFLRHAFAA